MGSVPAAPSFSTTDLSPWRRSGSKRVDPGGSGGTQVPALSLRSEAAGNTFMIPPGGPLCPPPSRLLFLVQVWLEAFSHLTPCRPLCSPSASPPGAGTLPCDLRFRSFRMSLRHLPRFANITLKIRIPVFIIPLVTNAEPWKWSKGPPKNRWANQM